MLEWLNPGCPLVQRALGRFAESGAALGIGRRLALETFSDAALSFVVRQKPFPIRTNSHCTPSASGVFRWSTKDIVPRPSRCTEEPVATKKKTTKRTTHQVSDAIFKQVYDSPSSLPGKFAWVTSDVDVRKIEKLLGMPSRSIGAPLWVSGDTKECKKCGRETNWLDIISSGLARQHDAAMIVRVILGDRKFVNVEAPNAIADLRCYRCKTPIVDLRSFKCHNWAYAFAELQKVIDELQPL